MNDTVVTDSVKRFKWVGTRPIRPDGVPKVTGRAMYGGDYKLPGMLYGRILRSPHAHARIRSIDTSAAEKLPGVKAVMTGKDLPDQKFDYIGPERVAVNFWHVTRNIMAREKAYYEGHAVAAVAAISASIADEAAALIKVDYEVLPHVIDVDEAMADGAPLLFEDMITRGVEPAPTKPSNISKRLEFQTGDIDAGFAAADVVIEKEFKTAAVHQGYIEPHACLARWDADGQTEIWSSSQGHFQMRALTAQILQKPIGDLRVYPAEIGGGFGGKTVTYLEPIATLLSMKSGSPVRLMMNRDDVFRATGPTSGSSMWVKMGVTKDGKLVAADGLFKFQAGAFPGSPVMNGCLCAFAPYDIANARAVGYDVVCNRPKSAAYRAPGSPISAYAVESVIDMLATKIGMDPLELRLKNAARIGTPTIYGPKHAHEGYVQTLEALKNHPAYKTKLGKNQGRGLASGYWFNGGGDFECDDPGERRWHGAGGDRQPGYRRLARLDGDHGSRDSRRGLQRGAGDCRRHRVGGLHARDRRFACHVRHRHRSGERLQGRGQGPVQAGRADLGRGPRRRDLGRRVRQAGRLQRRRLRTVVAEGAGGEVVGHRRTNHRGGVGECRRAGAWLLQSVLRRRGGPRDRQGDHTALRRGAGCRSGDPPELRRGADPGRRRAGHRLGAERGVHLQRQGSAR